MLEYISTPLHIIKINETEVSSFVLENDKNLDPITVKSFGEEWERFNDFSNAEIQEIGGEYFDIISSKHINSNSVVLDVGCGSGRWSRFIADKVRFVEAIDPSSAVLNAVKVTQNCSNVRITQAGVDNLPFKDDSFDFVFSLGVLHHIPDTQEAMNSCVRKLKPEGYFLVYLYYNLDDRGSIFRFIFNIANLNRLFISKMPSRTKAFICDVVALFVYFPLAKISHYSKKLFKKSNFYTKIPLNYYHNKSFYVMRNDALDRFGTPLEQRFDKEEIRQMMENSGLSEIVFSDSSPYWHAVGKKVR